MRSDEHKDGGIDYRVFRHTNTKIAMVGSPKSPIVKVPSPDGFAYCFSVPSGSLVLRRGGNIFTTGNCGMVAQQTGYTASDLPDDLSALHSAFCRSIPSGVGKGHPDAQHLDKSLELFLHVGTLEVAQKKWTRV